MISIDLSVDIPVVSIAKPKRKKRKTTTKPKAKKANGKTKTTETIDETGETDETKAVTDDTTTTDTANQNHNHTTDIEMANGTSETTEAEHHDDTKPETDDNKDSAETDSKKRKLDELDKPNENNKPTTTTTTSDSDSDSGPLSCLLTDCLSSFIKEEKVEGYLCDSCQQKSEASKRLFIHSLPRVLCIVLKRFCWTATSRAKIDTQVTIPFNLDVSDFLVPPDEKDKKPPKKLGLYELRSVVMHHGVGLLSGHYTCYCYNEIQDVWVHYNDARVSLVTKDQVEREAPGQAYMMFYQQITPSIIPFSLLGSSPLPPPVSSVLIPTPIPFPSLPPHNNSIIMPIQASSLSSSSDTITNNNTPDNTTESKSKRQKKK